MLKNVKKQPQNNTPKNPNPKAFALVLIQIIFFKFSFPPVEAKDGALSSSRRVI